ncbi:lysophospholipase L2 [Brucella sp. BO2]|uniref:alpha/beta fold hydrolase n=1 Tax=Brucella sp. BO2 TaxID=693750 RepID=UPI0001E44607|nr:alpha/beta hydrolase [Brucella sp. BO2]EFM58192.1 lysophospholipase L2 [Brucella sp. BO2]QPN28963.1 alpha/beta hydrolase [Brucella sp. BO2]
MSFKIIHHLPAFDGATLPFRCLVAERPRGVVQLCHGLAEHSARYERFASALAGAGYHVYAQDHRGHGANITSHAPKGMFAPKQGHAVAIKDVRTLNHYIHQTYADLPVVLFGHSMGGLIALNYVFAHADTVDAVAIWNSNFDGGAQTTAALALLYMERMLKGSDVPSGILPRLTFRAWGRSIKGHRTLFDWLSHDPAEVDAYIADPLCGFDASVALWIDIFHMIRRGANNRNFASIPKHLPFHLIGGAEDPATAGGAAIQRLAERMRRMGFDRVTHNILPATRHESLNEINQDAVTQKFLGWLMEALPSRATER